ncbi:Hypothetical predicted protein [Pelobates cultripes]|uniref:Uncharacterized protein n=1 Tax=Pelobates cultripes TaxID=61616 RepID=A0AAD1WPZ1_PELCU|nr:Hypothetical predicted protein [Pelobates cultripes]
MMVHAEAGHSKSPLSSLTGCWKKWEERGGGGGNLNRVKRVLSSWIHVSTGHHEMGSLAALLAVIGALSVSGVSGQCPNSKGSLLNLPSVPCYPGSGNETCTVRDVNAVYVCVCLRSVFDAEVIAAINGTECSILAFDGTPENGSVLIAFVPYEHRNSCIIITRPPGMERLSVQHDNNGEKQAANCTDTGR